MKNGFTFYLNSRTFDEQDYLQDLKIRQKQHLNNINKVIDWQPCLHDSCPECIGTGIKKDGSICIHHISCPCRKCTPY